MAKFRKAKPVKANRLTPTVWHMNCPIPGLQE